MEENISRFLSAIIAIFLFFIFPVYMAYEKKDDVAYALALNSTQDFVDKVRNKGYITKDLYNDYVKSLYASGNTYKIDMEHEYISYDANPNDGEIVSAKRNSEIFNSNHILNVLDNEQKYVMNVNDDFRVKITNTNVTPATVIYNIITLNMSNNNVRLYVDYGGKINSEKWYASDLSYSEFGGVVSPDRALDISITANDISEVEEEGETDTVEAIADYLANYVKLGDYVDYPITFIGSQNYDWQVIDVDVMTKAVTLVARQCSPSKIAAGGSEFANVLNNECNRLFLYPTLGNARCITQGDENICKATASLNQTFSSRYWLIYTDGSIGESNGVSNTSHNSAGIGSGAGCTHSFYMRPVVELLPGTLCLNKDTGDGKIGNKWQIK